MTAFGWLSRDLALDVRQRLERSRIGREADARQSIKAAQGVNHNVSPQLGKYEKAPSRPSWLGTQVFRKSFEEAPGGTTCVPPE